MKKLVTSMIILALFLTACSETQPQQANQGGSVSEIAIETSHSTTAFTQVPNTPRETAPIGEIALPDGRVVRDSDFGISEIIPGCHELRRWEFDSLDMFTAFIQRSTANRASGLESDYLSRSGRLSPTNVYMPQNVPSELVLSNIGYGESSHVVYTYALSNYVYNNNLSHADNDILSTATFLVCYAPVNGGQGDLALFTNNDFHTFLTEHNGIAIYHRETRCYESEMFLGHAYVFLVNDRFVLAAFPPIEGFDRYDMVPLG
jgi:hypothetical protein